MAVVAFPFITQRDRDITHAYCTAVIDRFDGGSVMFDIDDTLLRTTSRIEEIIDVARYAKKRGMKVVLITARPDIAMSRSFTRSQLAAHNISYDELYFDAPKRKKTRKRELSSRHAFVMSVGDAWTDVDGDWGGIGIKLGA